MSPFPWHMEKGEEGTWRPELEVLSWRGSGAIAPHGLLRASQKSGVKSLGLDSRN